MWRAFERPIVESIMIRLIKSIGGAITGGVAGLFAGTVGLAVALVIVGIVLLALALLAAGVVLLLGLHWPTVPGSVPAGVDSAAAYAGIKGISVYAFFRITGAVFAIGGAWHGFKTAWEDNAPFPKFVAPTKRAVA
jgi:hypothetical protein